MRRVPLLPTLLVALAVVAMIALGVWQLHRRAWKEALLAQYSRAATLSPVAWPAVPPRDDALLFRRATGFCLQVTGWRTIAGRNLKDEPGWAHIAACRTGAEGPGMAADMGWSSSSDAPKSWHGGAVRGTIAPDRLHQIRLVSATAAPGLQPSAPPSPDSIPNNHLLYAIQWFTFAVAAALIYALALKRRRKDA